MSDRKTRADIEHDLREVIAEIFPHQRVELSSGTPLFNGGLSLNSTQMIEQIGRAHV